MQLSPDMATFFAVFLGFPLTFAEDIQSCGINHQVRVLMPGGCFKTDVNRFCSLVDTCVIWAAQRDTHQSKNGINKTLCCPQGPPKYTFNYQNSGYGKIRRALRSPPVCKAK